MGNSLFGWGFVLSLVRIKTETNFENIKMKNRPTIALFFGGFVAMHHCRNLNLKSLKKWRSQNTI